eukprot:TRINITY_DN11689_c0_g1::TRINITY_DN11689_c0_g1_i1::g.17486::m.17486 TRINITY_DN11689_c0_g1::TRINITY_DN11689_c0_g1_i1::g.17486  ORF type:complete len:136 (+),score=-7.95,Pre-SET/PF05033.11/0.037 TRINITY_DN11689_c0_g1_i1:1218-1625(+)
MVRGRPHRYIPEYCQAKSLSAVQSSEDACGCARNGCGRETAGCARQDGQGKGRNTQEHPGVVCAPDGQDHHEHQAPAVALQLGLHHRVGSRPLHGVLDAYGDVAAHVGAHGDRAPRLPALRRRIYMQEVPHYYLG